MNDAPLPPGETRPYLGRIAPTPTGFLHAGHAATFLTAWQRAKAAGGKILLRIEDLDPGRCKPEFADAAIEDLGWLGIRWDAGPVFQSRRRARYLAAWKDLRDRGFLYPCRRSRRDVATAGLAPHGSEPVFPAAWRTDPSHGLAYTSPAGINWRFRVPDGEDIVFHDGRHGRVTKTAGTDFGDFLVWNRDDVPAYELAVVVDDLADGVTEVVRGDDLLTSTARQILVARALGGTYPATCHCPLVLDAHGRRLAKRSRAASLRHLRAQGAHPGDFAENAPLAAGNSLPAPARGGMIVPMHTSTMRPATPGPNPSGAP
jgi:glutamyl/glutaminyl-tRNA synthetase